eukprot:g896.t1
MTNTKKEPQFTSTELLKRDDLVAVDGVVYNIEKFAKVHPGGSQIRAAGAYDASALYHSMHPFFEPQHSKLLQQYRVGIHLRNDPSKDIVYDYNSEFAKDLKRSVAKVLPKNEWWAPATWWIRTFFIVLGTLVSEYYWMSSGKIIFSVLVGLFHAQIGLSIQHDASHGSISSHSWINSLFAYGADWIGNSRWIWFEQHILWHHPHTNHEDLDPDQSSGEPLLNFCSTKRGEAPGSKNLWYHRFQHLYCHVILALYGISVIFNPYVINLKHSDLIPSAIVETKYMKAQARRAWILRAFYLFRTSFVPWYFGGAPLLLSLFVHQIVAGANLAWMFAISHNFDETERYGFDDLLLTNNQNLPQEANGTGEEQKGDSIDYNPKKLLSGKDQKCWYKQQGESSCSYGGVVGGLINGGLNMQIEHHFFPRMNSIHYPTIAPVVRSVCKRHGVKYVYYDTIFENTYGLLQYMYKEGTKGKNKLL